MEILKEFQINIFRHHITAYIDYKNVTYDNFTTERVLR